MWYALFFVLFGMSIDLVELDFSAGVDCFGGGAGGNFYIIIWDSGLFFLRDIFPEFWITPGGLITVLLFYAIPKEVEVNLREFCCLPSW
ncbi:MAG: hypothetical protein R3B47_03500 [Bacteroidia bacterium]